MKKNNLGNGLSKQLALQNAFMHVLSIVNFIYFFYSSIYINICVIRHYLIIIILIIIIFLNDKSFIY